MKSHHVFISCIASTSMQNKGCPVEGSQRSHSTLHAKNNMQNVLCCILITVDHDGTLALQFLKGLLFGAAFERIYAPVPSIILVFCLLQILVRCLHLLVRQLLCICWSCHRCFLLWTQDRFEPHCGRFVKHLAEDGR